MHRVLNNHSRLRATQFLLALALGGSKLGASAASLGLDGNTKTPGFAALPLYFEAADGQTSGQFSFLARGRACNFFVGPTEAVLVLARVGAPQRPGSAGILAGALADDELAGKGAGAPRLSRLGRDSARSAASRETRELYFEFVGANAAARVAGADQLAGTANYFLGHDSAQWRTGVPLFARARVPEIYPGVDLVYYGNDQRLEYDFVVAPGANPGRIAIRFTGADQVQVNAEGELVFTLGHETIRQPKPIVYQTVRGVRRSIAAGYALDGRQTVTFSLGDYDRTLPLVIDPVLSYSTFYGGTGLEVAWAVGVDTNGFVYVAGETTAALPAPPGTATNQFHGNGLFKGDAFVAKFNNAGSSLVYLAYLGGSADDVGLSLAVDEAGNAYVTGYTDSTDFPTQNALYPHLNGSAYPGVNVYPIDAFVTKLGPSGTNLIYSTYLGGDWVDQGLGIAVDKTGAAYVTGYTESTNFPTLTELTARTNYGGGGDAFLTKLGPAGTNVIYSLYLGGTNLDVGSSVAANADGLAFVTGYTRSTNFPVFRADQPRLAGGLDAFVTVIGTSGTNPVYSTYLGGSSDNAGLHITLDAATNIYVTGLTAADPSFPIKPSAVNPGGVFRSDDGAANWSASTEGLGSVVASALAIDPVTPTRMYAGTWRGVVRSVDAGANWDASIHASFSDSILSPGIALGLVQALAIDPATPTTVYAGTSSDGVWKSLDAGTNWSLSTTGLASLNIGALAVNPQQPARIYAGTAAGVYVSTNAATNWSAANNGLGNFSVRGLTLHPATSTTVYAATANGVYRSTDAGASWLAFNSGLSNLSTRTLVIDPVNPATLYLGIDGGVFKSFDAGTNWSQINTGLTGTIVQALVVDPLSPAIIYAGTSGGLFKSTDGATNWNLATNGLTVTSIASLALRLQAPATLYAGTVGQSIFGGEDAFVFKLGSNGFSAVLGGLLNDEALDVAVDAAGHAHVVGYTFSTNFPTQNSSGFLSDTNAGSADAFVVELSADGGTLLHSAYLGGSDTDKAYGIALDPVGNTYIVGETSSTNFPTLSAYQSGFGGVKDAFLAKLVTDTGPVLQIAPAENGVLLSWPPFWAEFTAETSLDLGTGSPWTPLAAAPVQTNGTLTLRVETNNPSSFFRLRRTLAAP